MGPSAKKTILVGTKKQQKQLHDATQLDKLAMGKHVLCCVRVHWLILQGALQSA